MYKFKKKDDTETKIGKTVANVADKYCHKLYIPVKKNGFILVGRRKGYYNNNCLAVIDFDIKNKDSLQYVINILEENNIYIDETFAQQTGSGGLHLFYEVNGNIAPKSFPSEYKNEDGSVTDGLLNNSEHRKWLKGVDTRGNGGKIFIAGTKMVEHNGGEYKIISNKTPKLITEDQFFDILGLFVDKATYDNVDSGKRKKPRSSIEFDGSDTTKKKKNETIKSTPYTAQVKPMEAPIDDPRLAECMRPTRDFWRGDYIIQKNHNGMEHMYWSYFLVDLDLHGIHIEESVKYFRDNPHLQPEFDDVETLYQYQRPFIQEKIYPECFEHLSNGNDKILTDRVFERYFPEYVTKKKLNRILPSPNKNIDHFEEDNNIFFYEPSNEMKEKIKLNGEKIKNDILDFLHSEKKMFILASQVGSAKTKAIKEAIYEFVGADLETKEVSMTDNLVEYYTISNKARPIKYINTDFPSPPHTFYTNVVGKVETVDEEQIFHCQLAEVCSKDPRFKDIKEHCQYFFGCAVNKSTYGILCDKYDPDNPNALYLPHKTEDIMLCAYHGSCEWIAQKEEIINNYDPSKTPNRNFLISTIFQYKFIREITNEGKIPDVIIFDESFHNWQLQQVKIGKINEWYNRPDSLFHGSDEHLERFNYAKNKYEYCVCINNFSIREDVWDCLPSTIYDFGFLLYQVNELKKSTNKVFGIIRPSIDLRKIDEWKKVCERGDYDEIKRMLKQYGDLTVYGKTLLNIPPNTKIIFSSATTPLSVVKELFKEDLYDINEMKDMNPEEIENAINDKIEIYEPDEDMFKSNYFPNPVLEIITKSTPIKGKKGENGNIVQWTKEQIKNQIEKVMDFIHWYRFTRPLIIMKKDVESKYVDEIKRFCPNAKTVHYGDAVGRNDCFYDEIEDENGNIKREYIDAIIVIGRFAYDELSIYMYKQIGIKHFEEFAKGDIIQAIGRGRPLELSDIPIVLFSDRDIFDSKNKITVRWSKIVKILGKSKEELLKCKKDKDFMFLAKDTDKSAPSDLKKFRRFVYSIEDHKKTK